MSKFRLGCSVEIFWKIYVMLLVGPAIGPDMGIRGNISHNWITGLCVLHGYGIDLGLLRFEVLCFSGLDDNLLGLKTWSPILMFLMRLTLFHILEHPNPKLKLSYCYLVGLKLISTLIWSAALFASYYVF